MASSIDWYFDFVSPYSYIGLHRLNEFSVPIACKPVLFAGLLNHWGQKGPAEIPAKRKWTYRSCHWWAGKLGLPFRFPALHPFNPLHHLRLALACGSEIRAVTRIFDSIWTTGEDAGDPARFAQLCQALKVDPARLGSQEIKDQLRKNTEDAAARGVFGVPTFVIDGEVFWGADSVEFAKEFLADPRVLDNDEMRRLDSLPAGAARTR
jgi:2-hydroxychromene-2-carboxylate isomerase